MADMLVSDSMTERERKGKTRTKGKYRQLSQPPAGHFSLQTDCAEKGTHVHLCWVRMSALSQHTLLFLPQDFWQVMDMILNYRAFLS